MVIVDKWEIEAKNCRECAHLISLEQGAKNIRGEEMTPRALFFTIKCGEQRAGVLVQNPKRFRGCPFFERSGP